MAYRVLARQYRPQQFREVVGQDHVIDTLTRGLSRDRVAHAYIFSGPRGIGKTTTARLLAMALNCTGRDLSEAVEPCNDCTSCRQIRESRDVDVIEIDGASNNSVDQVRELRENARYAPAREKKKVYIIDEVHMLSRSAFNALLKILEEPPDHVVFIFATTEIEQVPDTVLSRCQRYDFRLISPHLIAESLQAICEAENVEATPEALFLIARFAEGSLRDAQSILDQMINFAGRDESITEDLVGETWGIAPFDALLDFLDALAERDADRLLDNLRNHLDRGRDLMELISSLAEMHRHCLLLKQDGPEALRESLPEERIEELDRLTERFSSTELTWAFDELIDLHRTLRQHSRFQQELAEVRLVRLAEGRPRYNLAEIIERLEAFENAPNAHSSPPTESPNDAPVADVSSPATDTQSEDPENSSGETPDAPDGTTTDSGEESSPEVRTTGELDDEQWNGLLEAVRYPTRSYLDGCDRAELSEAGNLLLFFSPEWEEHAHRLQEQPHQSVLEEAVAGTLGSGCEVTINVGSKERKKSGAPNEDAEENDADGEFLRQTREVLNPESVSTLETEDDS